jgi:hypothetical protein
MNTYPRELIERCVKAAYTATRRHWGTARNDRERPDWVMSRIERDVVKVLDGHSARELHYAWRSRKVSGVGHENYYKLIAVNPTLKTWSLLTGHEKHAFCLFVNAVLAEKEKFEERSNHFFYQSQKNMQALFKDLFDKKASEEPSVCSRVATVGKTAEEEEEEVRADFALVEKGMYQGLFPPLSHSRKVSGERIAEYQKAKDNAMRLLGRNAHDFYGWPYADTTTEAESICSSLPSRKNKDADLQDVANKVSAAGAKQRAEAADPLLQFCAKAGLQAVNTYQYFLFIPAMTPQTAQTLARKILGGNAGVPSADSSPDYTIFRAAVLGAKAQYQKNFQVNSVNFSIGSLFHNGRQTPVSKCPDYVLRMGSGLYENNKVIGDPIRAEMTKRGMSW